MSKQIINVLTEKEGDVIMTKECNAHHKCRMNWTKSPRNCATMNKLLKGCLLKSQNIKNCSNYNRLMSECQNNRLQISTEAK